jgi:hypothetical protein
MGKTVANFMIERLINATPAARGRSPSGTRPPRPGRDGCLRLRRQSAGRSRVFYRPARPTHATRAGWRGDAATVHRDDELAA